MGLHGSMASINISAHVFQGFERVNHVELSYGCKATEKMFKEFKVSISE